MPLVLKDRVRETTTTAGTGSVTLLGAATGFQSFSAAMAINDTTYYTIAGQGTNEWEVGIGTLTGSTTLARTTILASSNSGNIVTFSAGTKDVFITYPAIEAVPKSFLDGAYETVSTNPSSNVFSSGSWAISANINSNETANVGITFSPDGLNMYTSGETSDAIDQYSLSRAFDVTSISYVRTFSVSAQTTQPRGITFDPTGVFMYVGDDLNNRIIRYVLGTAWNISTAGTPTFYVVSAQTTVLGYSIQFRPNGLEMFICNQTSTVFTYSLSVAWDITTSALLRVNNFESNLRGFVFSNDGLRLFTLDSAGTIRRRSPPTAWNTNGIGGAGTADQTVTFAATNFPVATYSFPSFSLYLNEAVTGISAGIRMFTVLPGPAGAFEYIGQFQLSAANDISLMRTPLFDLTGTTSRQVNISPGTAPNYIAQFGTPGVDFLGMTKQLKIVAPTVIVNNASRIITLNFTNMSLSTGDILQVTCIGGGVWQVTDLTNTLKINLYNLSNDPTGIVAFNPNLNTFDTRTIVTGTAPGIFIENGDMAAGNVVLYNNGIRVFNQRFNTDNINLWWHKTTWYQYGPGGYTPWLNNINQGTFFVKQIGGGFNNTDTPDAFYWDKNTANSNAVNFPGGIGFPIETTNRNSFLRRYYYYGTRWYQREMIYMAEANWNTNSRATRSMSELVLGANWLAEEDVPNADYSYNYAIPFTGDTSQNPATGSTRATGNFLVSGTTASPTIVSVAVTTTSEIRIHVSGRSFLFTAWTADGAVSIKQTGGGYTPYIATITFAANTTFYYNYWCEGDITSRTFVKVFVNNTATANWSYQIGEDYGGTVWRALIQSANRANYIGGFWTDANGFVFTSSRLERLWSSKSMALPMTTNTVARCFTIQCKFRVDNITTQDQNVFWIANAVAPATAQGIRVRINEGTVDRRLSISLATSAAAAIITSLKCWQFEATGTSITVTFVWNPLDTTFAGRLYVNDYMMYKTNTNPFGAATNWFNVGATADGTANGFEGRLEYLFVVPEVWGAYVPQGNMVIDVDAGDAGWVAANNNGAQDVVFSSRNNFGYRGYLRGSSWGIGANVRVDNGEYLDAPVIPTAADTFTLLGDTVSGSPTITLAKTTAGFSRNSGRFYITGTGLPTTSNNYAYINYGDKTFNVYDRNGAVNATSTANGTTFTFIRINGSNEPAVGPGGFLNMPGNAIFVAKTNTLTATFTNELAGINSSTETTTCAFPTITFTVLADANIDEFYYTQNTAGNDTAARNLINALSIGPKQYTVNALAAGGISPTSATVDNARITGVDWDLNGRGLHRITLSRARNAAVTPTGTTITAVFVPNPSSGYLDFETLGGFSTVNTDNGETFGYSPQEWWYSSQRDMKAMMATAGIGQWRYTRIAPPGGVYDSGIFRPTTTTFARNMYLPYGSIGYLINYGTTGDFNQSTVNPVVSTIAWAATNGMNSDGFSLTVVANTFYRVIIYPFGTSLDGDVVS